MFRKTRNLLYGLHVKRCPGSLVGKANELRVERSGIEWRTEVTTDVMYMESKVEKKNPGGYEIFRPSRPALGRTQPPVKRVPGLYRG